MYATAQDIIDIYTEEELLIVADRDDNGTYDVSVVDGALRKATSKIDSYVSQRYSLPLPSVPDILREHCVDIALYRLSASSGYAEEKRQRYEDSIRWLEQLAAGKVGLGLPDVDPGEGEPDPDATIEITSEERLFNRKSMKQVL
jgi:phage gp36-like protein